MEDEFERADQHPLEMGHPITTLLREDLLEGGVAEDLIREFREAELAAIPAEFPPEAQRPEDAERNIQRLEDARSNLFRRLVQLEMYFQATEALRVRIAGELAKNPHRPRADELYSEFLARHGIRSADVSEPTEKKRRRAFAYFYELEARCPDELRRLIRREITSKDFPNDEVWMAATAALAKESRRSSLSDEGVINAIQEALTEFPLPAYQLPVPRGESPTTRASLRAAHKK